MRVLWAVLGGVLTVACGGGERPRIEIVQRGGETYRIDNRTGEVARRTANGWEVMQTQGPNQAPARPQIMPLDLVDSVRTRFRHGPDVCTLEVSNDSTWTIHEITLLLNGEEVTAMTTSRFMGQADPPLPPGRSATYQFHTPLVVRLAQDGYRKVEWRVKAIEGFPR